MGWSWSSTSPRGLRCIPAPAAVPISKAASMACVLACRIRRPSPIGSIGTPAAASCSARLPKRRGGWGALFAGGQVEKVYWAIVEGEPPETEGSVETGVKKLTRGTGWRMVIDPTGQRAVTDYRVCGAAGGRAWLELRPRTGRTHQLRVHCAALGCPVVGDPVYGSSASKEPLQLYARSITLPLYPARPALAITAPAPPHMLAALRRLGYDPGRSLTVREADGRDSPPS